MVRDRARAQILLDLLREARADAGDLSQLPARGDGRDVLAEALDRAGALAVGVDPERRFLRELEKVGDLREEVREFEVVGADQNVEPPGPSLGTCTGSAGSSIAWTCSLPLNRYGATCDR